MVKLTLMRKESCVVANSNKMHSLSSVVLYTLSTYLLWPPAAQAQTVLGSSSSGTFWGINMNPDAATVKYPLYPGYTRSTGSMSYDAHTGHSLFEHFEPHTLSYGPVCSSSPGLTPKLLFNITDAILEQADLGDAFTGFTGAFAMHNSKIYFLHYGSYESVTTGSTHRFQVRVLNSCEECGVDPYAADSTASMSMSMLYTVRCSRVVAQLPNIVNGLDEFPTEYQLGKVLKVVSGEGDELAFYFQLGRFRLKGEETITEMLMYKVTAGGSHELIHTQRIDNHFRAWSLNLIGAVDYLNGVLCWTTADRMLCRFKDGDKPKTIVTPGTAVGKGICTGTSTVHLNDISGVAILKAGAERTVLFGCSPQTSNVSGSGIVEIDANDRVASIKAFRAEKELLSAAGLVTVKVLPTECSFDPSPVLCVRLQHVTTETAQQIPTLPTTFQPKRTPKPEVGVPEVGGSEVSKERGEKGDEGDNEPSGEPGATGGQEDNVVDDGMAVVGGDQTGGATCVKTAGGTRLVLHLAAAVATACLLLS